ncbi:23S rRNA (guanosine2251-2'-O)-methyltransferase [Nonlabens dokdonensis]|uniref:RNA methyltransferase, TrmH family, group 3 n=2 Tax=Nonlabens dokdonensis TaxID=328515 RepID=L7W6C1_NONDD|nr:23S rRNA (guanosine(2251)-2'-O)-methyltransferase RlmB [Nonlabens dokdonensis]AGC75679.1 RNA methyltransferase, TrmH family, group 3 [Nonlabens dokdonensis DSW-6]PZX43367.1 23S rRNA (guanosine2251-2'-O)-methyltransferase [Nonlabens dokdonensis]
MEKTTFIYGIRAIIEAIESEKEISKVYLLKDGDGVLMQQLKNIARKNNITTSYVPIEKLNHLARGNHQGAVASISPIQFHSLEQILENIDGESKPLFLLLDGVTDVRNFGAIIRTAECTGVTAIVISEKGSAPVNAATVKTSVGAVFNIPICKVNHIKDAVFLMQAYGIKTAGANEKADDLIYDIDLNQPMAIVMGSEEKGINPSTLKILDHKVKLPMRGDIASLNVSVACGAMLYETLRQRL